VSNIEHLDRMRRTTRPGSLADHDPRDFRYSRTQRDAGIEHLEWEDRIKPIRPIWLFAMAGACWIVLGTGIAWMAAMFSG
jgi:hypothetical protein